MRNQMEKPAWSSDVLAQWFALRGLVAVEQDATAFDWPEMPTMVQLRVD
jgi:hypothetical protein